MISPLTIVARAYSKITLRNYTPLFFSFFSFSKLRGKDMNDFHLLQFSNKQTNSKQEPKSS